MGNVKQAGPEGTIVSIGGIPESPVQQFHAHLQRLQPLLGSRGIEVIAVPVDGREELFVAERGMDLQRICVISRDRQSITPEAEGILDSIEVGLTGGLNIWACLTVDEE